MYDPALTLSWQDSRDYCRQNLGELAALESSGEHTDVMEWLEQGNEYLVTK